MRPTPPTSLTLGIALTALCLGAAPDPPATPPGFWAVTATILAHHVEAPARQHMIHSGIVGMYRAVDKPIPAGLGARLSALTTPGEFAALLAEVRPKPSGNAGTEGGLDRAFLEGLSDGVPGGLELMEAKDRRVAEQMAGNRYVGVQIAVEMDAAAGLPKIRQVLKGGPADRAGMLAGDVIEAVDGTDIGGGTLKEYVDRLRGPEGTGVTVRARRPGEKKSRTFRMARAALPHVTITGTSGAGAHRLDGPDPIGYARLDEILSSTPRELRELAAKMEAEGLKAVVLDLRGLRQGQGDLHAAVLLADELLDGGTIGHVRTADRKVTYTAEPGALFRDWPMAVLVDGETAGHSEWIAAALQDNKRAPVVGLPTSGQGGTRSTVPVGDGAWAATLVTGLLERRDGRAIGYYASPRNPALDRMQTREGVPPEKSPYGVTPDVVVPQAPNRDDALTAAADILRKAIPRPEASKIDPRAASTLLSPAGRRVR